MPVIHSTDTHGWLEGHLKEQNYGGEISRFNTHPECRCRTHLRLWSASPAFEDSEIDRHPHLFPSCFVLLLLYACRPVLRKPWHYH